MTPDTKRPLKPDYVGPLVVLGELTRFSPYHWAEISDVDRAQLSRLLRGLSEFAGDEVTLRLGHGAMTSEFVTMFDVDQFYTGVGLRSMLPRGYRKT